MKATTYLFLFLTFPILLISCNNLKFTNETFEENDSLAINERVKNNAKKHFHFLSSSDSLNDVSIEVALVDSFTLKENIDYRRSQIVDSINCATKSSQIESYKQIKQFLDSIEVLSHSHLNEIVSYYYKITKRSETPTETQTVTSGIQTKESSSTTEIYIYTDSTPNREIIWSTEEKKNLIQNPFDYPDYYKRIDRSVITKNND